MNLDNIFFTLGGIDITYGHFLAWVLTIFMLAIIHFFIVRRLLRAYFQQEEVSNVKQRTVRWLILSSLVMIFLIFSFALIDYDYSFPINERRVITLSTIFKILLALQLTRVMDWLLSDVLARRYTRSRGLSSEAARESMHSFARASGMVRPFVYTLAILLLIYKFNLNFVLFSYPDPKVTGSYKDFHFSMIVVALLIFFGARLLNWILIQLGLATYYRRKEINIGTQYAINQLVQYFLFVIAALIILQYIGVQLTVLWGGAAALLVGIGLGLQQTFTDLISGLILLFDRSVEVADVIQVNELIGSVKKIGIRTSLVETWDGIMVIVPNSKLLSDYVINWSHYSRRARFHLKVGVAYGSDTQLVKKLLLQAATSHEKILKRPMPLVRFVDFGDSSLDFELLFWAKDLPHIEDIKSDLRFKVDQLFRENKVTIPFPQRDVWMKKE